jgi:hypothetical protein
MPERRPSTPPVGVTQSGVYTDASSGAIVPASAICCTAITLQRQSSVSSAVQQQYKHSVAFKTTAVHDSNVLLRHVLEHTELNYCEYSALHSKRECAVAE